MFRAVYLCRSLTDSPQKTIKIVFSSLLFFSTFPSVIKFSNSLKKRSDSEIQQSTYGNREKKYVRSLKGRKKIWRNCLDIQIYFIFFADFSFYVVFHVTNIQCGILCSPNSIHIMLWYQTYLSALQWIFRVFPPTNFSHYSNVCTHEERIK